MLTAVIGVVLAMKIFIFVLLLQTVRVAGMHSYSAGKQCSKSDETAYRVAYQKAFREARRAKVNLTSYNFSCKGGA